MDIKQVKAEITKLEGNLAVEIGRQIRAFHKKTGVSIKSVDVSTFSVQTLGDGEEKYIVANVSCDVAF